MDTAKRSADWLLQSNLMALIANVNASRGKKYQPEHFNLYPDEKRQRPKRKVKPSELERL